MLCMWTPLSWQAKLVVIRADHERIVVFCRETADQRTSPLLRSLGLDKAASSWPPAIDPNLGGNCPAVWAILE